MRVSSIVFVVCTNAAEQEAHVEQLLGRQLRRLVVPIMMSVAVLFLLGQDVRFEQHEHDGQLPAYPERGVVQDVPVGLAAEQHDVDDDDNRLEFDVLVGDVRAIALRRNEMGCWLLMAQMIMPKTVRNR